MQIQFDYHDKLKEKIFYILLFFFKKISFKYKFTNYIEHQFIVEYSYLFIFKKLEFNYFYGTYQIKFKIKKEKEDLPF